MQKTNPSPEKIPAIRRVLVTTDFSDLANHAIPYACALLNQGGELHVVNVQHPRALSHGSYQQDGWDPETRSEHARLTSDCTEQLRALIPEEAHKRGIKITPKIIEAEEPARAIAAAARNLGVDALCISSHGRTGLKAMVLGSVAQGVLAACDRPAFVVRCTDDN